MNKSISVNQIKRSFIMKSLNAIQKLFKIGKILSKIAFIMSVIGFCGCIVGIISLSFGNGGLIKSEESLCIIW